MSEAFTYRTISELSSLLHKKETSSTELTELYLSRAEALAEKTNSYIKLTRAEALKAAAAADKTLKAGEAGPLCGVPLGVKDIICQDGVEITCGSKILKGYVPPYDATAVAKLKQAGAVILGRLNMDEFAMGSSTENSAFGPVHNPWDLEYVPGGSSGGSAAAVAAGEAPAALGSDTGGSIRQPAAFCGVVGLKPTYGRVSRYGLVAFASSLDQIGPLTQDVRDAALLLNCLAGHDRRDATSLAEKVPDFTAALTGELKGLRAGVLKLDGLSGVDPEVLVSFRQAVELLAGAGVEIKEIELPHLDYGLAAYYIIAPSEASSNLARYDGVQYGLRCQDTPDVVAMYKGTRGEGFGDEVKRRIMLGTYALSSGYYDAYYLSALKVRRLLKNDFDQVFSGLDVVLTPTTPTAAFKLGEKTQDPIGMYLADYFTVGANLAGLPGISVPCGFSKAGLPIGMQAVAPALREDLLFKLAYGYEQRTEWKDKHPSI